MQCSAFLITLFIAFQPGDEPRAWKWDIAERVARRADPFQAAERRREAEHDGCRNGCGSGFIVDGKRNPELLMPHELMDTLAGAYDAPDPEVRRKARGIWMERVADLNLGDDFWDRLYVEGRPFFEAWAEYHRLTAEYQEASEGELERIEIRKSEQFKAICPLRAAALAAARKAFGREVFDQFLYEGVARGMFVSHSGPMRLEEALWIERGCT